MQKIMANTFTPLYDTVEDRIILVVNYEDLNNRVDLMITRKFILNFLSSAEEFMMQHASTKQTVQDNISVSATSANEPVNKDQNNLTKTDFTNLELFSKEKELLREVNFTYNTTTHLTIITFTSQQSQIVASLDYVMLRQVITAIKAAIPRFEWGIAMNF